MQITADIVIFKIIDNELNVLLIQRARDPFEGERCLPWWFVKDEETLSQTALRVLKKETWLTTNYLEEIGSFSDIQRDPRGKVISIGFLGVLTTDATIVPGVTQKKAMFLPIKYITNLGFDHKKILMKAYKALTDKISTDNISQYFLSKYFTLSEFQKVYEIILGHKIDKRNFRKDIVQKYNLKATPKKEFDVAHRPAVLYKFG